MNKNNRIHIGTSGWSYKDWLDVFYPVGTKQADYLSFYAKKYDTVEIDSTFYAIPRVSTVEGWFNKTPGHFKFALKVPQVITHEKRLSACESDWEFFISTIQNLKRRSRLCINASAPIRYPHGNWRNRFDGLRTMVRSIHCAAI